MATPTTQVQNPVTEMPLPQYAISSTPNEKLDFQVQSQYIQTQPQTQYEQIYGQQVPNQQHQYVHPQMQQQSIQPHIQYVQVPVQAAAPAANSTFAYATPLGSLQQGPAPVDCPVCKVRQITTIEWINGNRTHAWAAIFCILFGLPCIPYLMNSFKDVQHKCGNCGALLATWKKNSGTIVHAHPMVSGY